MDATGAGRLQKFSVWLNVFIESDDGFLHVQDHYRHARFHIGRQALLCMYQGYETCLSSLTESDKP